MTRQPHNLHYPAAFRSAVAGVVWPAVSAAPGASLLAVLFQLEQSQWWPAEQLLTRQLEQLQQLFEFLWPISNFHRQRLHGAGWQPGRRLEHETWLRLPTLSRLNVQAGREELTAHTSPAVHGRLLTFSTHGSLGTPVQGLGNELTHLFASALVVRNHFWHRRDLAGKFAAIRSKVESRNYPDWGLIETAAFHTGPSAVLDIATDIDRQIDWLTAEAPMYLLSHPSNLRALLLRARERGVTVASLRELASFGEMLPGDLRDLAQQIWHLPLVDLYSSEEFGNIALQCPEHPEHYHVQAENLLVEVVDAQDRPCAPGEVGRVLISTLHNFSMPLIRYEIGDYAALGEPCACGRGLPTLSRLAGRRRNMMSLPDGSLRWPSFPPGKLREIAAYRQIQIVQHSLTELEVRLAGIAPLRPDSEQAFADRLCDALRQRFAVRFSYPATISPLPGGKYEDFLNRVDAS